MPVTEHPHEDDDGHCVDCLGPENCDCGPNGENLFAAAGSATPTDPLRHAAQAVLDEYEVHDWFPDDHPLVQLALAVAGSATPTGDDDE